MTDPAQTFNKEHSSAPTNKTEIHEKELKHILDNKHSVGDPEKLKTLPAKELEAHQWVEIRLFMSSTFVDTHGERDLLIKKIIPALNEKFKETFIRIVPIDLRWGVSAKGSKDCEAIQTTCLNEVDHCRVMHDDNVIVYPYFLGLRTNRYGWVQDHLMDSTKYDKPKFYDWVNTLKEHAKKVSITSLECIHAALPLDVTLPSPAIFFYERFIENPEDINELERWIFEFEYKAENEKIKPEVEKQYQRRSAEEVEVYKNDQVSLNKWLKSLPHVKYDEYSCVYKEGGVQITGDNNGKKFGIGRVSGLKELEEMITGDLLDSIEMNFVRKAEENLSVSDKMNIPFEIAVREKSSTFFGRKDLVDELYKHFENSEGT